MNRPEPNPAREKITPALSWVALVFALSVLLAIILKTSPYRQLRPYGPLSSRLNPSANRKITIPSDATRDGVSFAIDERPVTIRAYLDCVDAGSCAKPHYRGYFSVYPRYPLYWEFPVTYIGVADSRAYCHAQGGDLPTLAQWEDAAGAQLGFRYPWGDAEATIARANFDGYYQGLTPSGWLPAGASPFGILDMGGNVREWVLDTLPSVDPRPNTEPVAENILKGGGSSDYPNQLEITARQQHSGASAGFNRGFRCVYELPSERGK